MTFDAEPQVAPHVQRAPHGGQAGAIPPAVQAAAAWSWRLLLIGAAIVATGWVLSRLTTIIIPVAMAVLVAVLLLPVRNVLQAKLSLGKKAAVAVTIVGSLLIISALMYFTFRQIYLVFPDFINQIVAGVNEVRNWVSGPPLNISNAQFDETWYQIQGYLTTGENLQSVLSGTIGAMGTVGNIFTMLMIMIFSSVFFLADGRTIWAWLINLLPVTARERAHQAGRRGAVTLSAYVRTKILVALVDGLGIGLGMLFFVPAFALPIGVLVFFFSAVPIFGAIVSGIIASILVLVSQGWVAALIMGVIVLLVQQTESSILLPLLLGKTVSLHPVAVVLAVTGGVMVAGLAGAIFAVPLVAVINTMVQYLFGNDKFPHLGEADHIPLLRRPDIGETVAGWQDQIRRVVSRPLRGSDDDDEFDDDEYDDD
ncbi:MAG: AI-2E family transporter, partial [Promicromonosporaceae bacterium]|nr:AI-2E family transporter [Promicromonosporaceae bacterium]